MIDQLISLVPKHKKVRVLGESLANFGENVFQSGSKSDVVVADLRESQEYYNIALDNLANYQNCGAIFIGGLQVVFHLVGEKYPILISQEFRDVSVFLPYKNLELFKIKTDKLVFTKDESMWKYIEWDNDFGNKNIVCRWEFLRNLWYNKFNEEKWML